MQFMCAGCPPVSTFVMVLQYECINCGAGVDAVNGVYGKNMNYPRDSLAFTQETDCLAEH